MPSKTGKDSYPDRACITFVRVKTDEFSLVLLLCRKVGVVDFFNGVMNLQRQIMVVGSVAVGAMVLCLILCFLSFNVHVELGLA